MTKNGKKRAMVAISPQFVLAVLVLFVTFRIDSASAQEATQTTFATPQEAVQSLSEATKAKDRDKLRQIFGASIKEILT